MTEREFLKHSADTPMTELRAKFNRGESLYIHTPAAVGRKVALEDIDYVRYVFENAYSGYDSFSADRFDAAFSEMRRAVREGPEEIGVHALVDLIADQLSFIEDGHLSIGTAEYGRGFYRRLRSYAADRIFERRDGGFADAASGEIVVPSEDVRMMPALLEGGREGYLAIVRSRDTVEKIEMQTENGPCMLPAHAVRSAEREEILLREEYADGLAYVACSSFVGDAEDDFHRFYEAGRRCRSYAHVIWDLSGNLGGNSEFPRRFVQGLNGGCAEDGVFELQSTLVHAKETGEICEIPRSYERMPAAEAVENFFEGTLHIIINDRVASSAESAIGMAKSLKNVVFYGCNSLGIGRYGDLRVYYLPNSGAVLWCPQKLFEGDIRETVGHEPDFWIDSENAAAVVKEYIRSRTSG